MDFALEVKRCAGTDAAFAIVKFPRGALELFLEKVIVAWGNNAAFGSLVQITAELDDTCGNHIAQIRHGFYGDCSLCATCGDAHNHVLLHDRRTKGNRRYAIFNRNLVGRRHFVFVCLRQNEQSVFDLDRDFCVLGKAHTTLTK